EAKDRLAVLAIQPRRLRFGGRPQRYVCRRLERAQGDEVKRGPSVVMGEGVGTCTGGETGSEGGAIETTVEATCETVDATSLVGSCADEDEAGAEGFGPAGEVAERVSEGPGCPVAVAAGVDISPGAWERTGESGRRVRVRPCSRSAT